MLKTIEYYEVKEKYVFIQLNLIKPPKNEEYLYPINTNPLFIESSWLLHEHLTEKFKNEKKPRQNKFIKEFSCSSQYFNFLNSRKSEN